MGMHKSELDQTAHRQTDGRVRPGWARDGAHARLCAAALIAVVFFVKIVKHGCRYRIRLHTEIYWSSIQCVGRLAEG